MSLVTSNDYNLLLMFTCSYDYWTEHDCCDAWIEHCIKFDDQRTHRMEKVRMNIYRRRLKHEDSVFRGYNYSTTCCYVCHTGRLCYWVSVSCNDLSSGEESLNVVFSCAMSLVMKFVDWHNDGMEKVGRNK